MICILKVCIFGHLVYAQYPSVDSLKKCIVQQKDPDSLPYTFIELSWEESYYGMNYDAIDHALRAIELASKRKNNEAVINAKNALVNAYDEIGEYKKAKFYFEV